MARPRTAKHVEEHPPEEESQEVPETNDQHDPEPETFALNGKSKPSSQADMIRAALAAGIDTPKEGVEWIKEHFGFEMKRTSFSASKAQVKNRGTDGGDSSRRTPQATGQPGVTAVPTGFGADIKSIKALMETAGGVDELKELVEGLGGLLGKYGKNGLTELIDAIG